MLVVFACYLCPTVKFGARCLICAGSLINAVTLSKFKQNQILLVYLMWFVEHNVYSLPRRAESQFKTMKTHEIFNVIKMYGASKKKKKESAKCWMELMLLLEYLLYCWSCVKAVGVSGTNSLHGFLHLLNEPIQLFQNS